MLYRLITFLMYFVILLIKEQNDFDTDTQQTFVHGEYKVTNKSNRVGMLLEGS